MLRVGCLTSGIIILFFLLGIWIDRKYETGNLFTAILMIASMPITMLAIFRWLRSSNAPMKAFSSDADKVEEKE